MGENINEAAIDAAAHTAQHDFEYGDTPKRVEITIRGRTGVYYLHDVSAQESIDIFDPVLNGGEIEAREAKRHQRAAVVAAVVRRENGSKITLDEALRMRALLVAQLYMEAQKYINGYENEPAAAGGEGTAKKESASEA